MYLYHLITEQIVAKTTLNLLDNLFYQQTNGNDIETIDTLQ